MIKVVLVEDHQRFLDAATKALNCHPGIQVIGTAINGELGMDLILQKQPDVVVTDINMPALNGLEMIKKLHRHKTQTKFIALTMYNHLHILREAIDLRINGFMLKGESKIVLLEAIKEVNNSTKTYISLTLRQALSNMEDSGKNWRLFTSRELQIARKIARLNSGSDVKRIDHPIVFDFYRRKIMAKLKLSTPDQFQKFLQANYGN